MNNFLKNYFSTCFFIFILYFFYKINPYFSNRFTTDLTFINFSLNTLYIFWFIIGLYIILLIPFYLVEKDKSKARIIFNYLKNQLKEKNYKISNTEKNAILSWIVKAFFAPLMIYSISSISFDLINKVYYGYKDYYILEENFLNYFNVYIFFGIFYLTIFIDLIFFTLGYLLEANFLKNKIKSVEPTMFGWVIAIACYPPFNSATSQIFGAYTEKIANLGNIYIHVTINIIILLLFIIYSWASVSLGLKASNLTNRGIVSKGPYKYVRHPAYITKNLGWILLALPIIIINFKDLDLKSNLLIFITIISWSTIYYLRAITEEKHLEKDEEYRKYQKKVKYKFIPKIF